MGDRALKIIAPWWAWKRQRDRGLATSPRNSRPHLQKFDRPDFVDVFLADPQRSYRFNEDDCYVAFGFEGGIAGTIQKVSHRLRSLLDSPPANGATGAAAVECVRKLFLDTHRRYYAVVCEVHCDAPGFPSATNEEICQAGFVIRRQVLSYPASMEASAREVLRALSAARAELRELSEEWRALEKQDPRRPTRAQKLERAGRLVERRMALEAEIAHKQQELLAWQEEAGARWACEGWVPRMQEGIGDWAPVEDAPEEIEEAYFPLYRLTPAEDDRTHDAYGRVIYFGVVPTSTLDTDPSGAPRLDHRHAYQIRCFVRRHKPGCPGTEDVPDCHGKLYWSEASEPFFIAAPFDLVGTSQRPITIVQPDMAELAAMAHGTPLGRFSPVRLVQKQNLQPTVNGTGLTGGAMTGAKVCFFAVPLVMIVAIFLFNIFLPIVLFVFGLWFLLALRICFPPSLSLSVQLEAELAALKARVDAGVDLDAMADITFNLPGTGEVTWTRDRMQRELAAEYGRLVAGRSPLSGTPLPRLSDLYATGMSLKAQQALPEPDDPLEVPAPGLDLLSGLQLEEHVPAPEVIA